MGYVFGNRNKLKMSMIRAVVVQKRRTYPRSKRRDGLPLVVRHVNAIPVDRPCRLVVGVQSKTNPHVLRELCRFLPGEGLLHDELAVLHEEVDLLSYNPSPRCRSTSSHMRGSGRTDAADRPGMTA